VLPVALALAASVGFGSADYLGGTRSRRMPVLTVLVVSQLAGLVVLLTSVGMTSSAPGDRAFLGYAAIGGIVQGLGLAAYYRSLALGTMGIMAPIAATAAVVPLTVGIASGERPSTVQSLGIGLALCGVALSSYESGGNKLGERRFAVGAGFALTGALGTGMGLAAIDAAAERGSVFWAVFINRLALVALLLTAIVALRRRISLPRADVTGIAAIGIIVAVSLLLFAEATTLGLISLVGVIAALYPITTVTLAHTRLSERMHARQQVGALAVFGGVALIAGG
jgi:uncharacterized membrane protein